MSSNNLFEFLLNLRPSSLSFIQYYPSYWESPQVKYPPKHDLNHSELLTIIWHSVSVTMKYRYSKRNVRWFHNVHIFLHVHLCIAGWSALKFRTDGKLILPLDSEYIPAYHCTCLCSILLFWYFLDEQFFLQINLYASLILFEYVHRMWQ